MYMPDYQIAHLSGDRFPTTWSPSGGPDVGREFPIQNPGPLVAPFDPAFLGPMSYDIAVDAKFASPQPIESYVVRGGQRMRPLKQATDVDGEAELHSPAESLEIVLQPHQALLCQSVEYVRVPPNLVGMLSMRSSFAREWLDHSAADSIWGGFQGHITFELRNNGPKPFILRSGSRVLQLAFVMSAGTPMRPYNGLYQNQKGQLHSRLKAEAPTVATAA